MIRNNIEVDVKVKYIENETTQAQFAETIGTTGQYVNRIIKKKDGVVNKTLKFQKAIGNYLEHASVNGRKHTWNVWLKNIWIC